MKKISKLLSVVLAVALIAALASVAVFAADPTPVSISVKTPPKKTAYYQDIDYSSIDGGLYNLDIAGMVIAVTYSDGTVVDVAADDYDESYQPISMKIENCVLGENNATVTCMVDMRNLTTTFPITIEENPVASVKITKMPNKTEYDMDKDMLTRENFTWDKLFMLDPTLEEDIETELGMTVEEFKAKYENDNSAIDYFTRILFEIYDGAILLVDTEGMEIEVTFKDGTAKTYTDEQNYVVYGDAEIPIILDQPVEIKEGKNTLTVSVAGVEAPFDVTVKKAATPVKLVTPDKPVDNRNPEIPNTDGGVSLALAGVLALVSGCGIALVPSKKKEQF